MTGGVRRGTQGPSVASYDLQPSELENLCMPVARRAGPGPGPQPHVDAPPTLRAIALKQRSEACGHH
jgi:hypothetical protein